MVKRVTDRLAVEAAMDEYDRVGRDAFLQKHNFGPALRYFVTRNGNCYDSKAIYGAAHEIQYPEDGKVSSADFSGGEKSVQAPLEALGFEFVIDNEGRAEEAAEPDLEIVKLGKITFEDVRLLGSSRAKQRYADLSDEEHAAYVRVSATLQALGERLKSALRNSDKFEVRTTSGFNVNSGVRSYIPKDLWFSVSPRDNAKDLAGMPQLFMIVSERGVEYGFGASVHPSDFSQQSIKQLVREAAPIVFDRLPAFDTVEASEVRADIETTGQWYFRRKHRLPPNQNDFSSFRDWLRFLQSDDGKKNAAGTISRYLQGDQIDQTDLQVEVTTMARLFSPLLDRDWHSPLGGNLGRNMAGETEFSNLLQRFLQEFAAKRSGAFTIDASLGQAMRALTVWLEQLPSLASRPTVRVKISVGQGGWTKTPWIALLDERETTTTQKGTYVVFLFAEDLSVTYLTLNQGMTELRNRLGQRGAAEEMVRVAEAARPLIRDLEDRGFTLDNKIDLRSDTSAARNYEIGTIAHVPLESDALPDDAAIEDYLENLLSGYERVLKARDRLNGGDDDPIVPDPAAPYSIDDILAELFLERTDIERYLDLWVSKKNLILQGAPGVGKSFVARRLAYALIGSKDDSKVQTVQFHQSYSYEDFVQGYRPNGSQGFERKNGTFFEFREKALRDPAGRYVFIIDEINRGNLSKIFGELMLLIEPDKREPMWATRLAYADAADPDFYIPENLYILGMMNTADRSLSLVDYALRRRFAFVAMTPLYSAPKFREYLNSQGVTEDVVDKIVTRMSELNNAIEADRINLGPGFRIGHSFFTPSRAVTDSDAWYRRIVEAEIYPLLEEYWFDAPENADQWRDQLLD